MPEVISTKCFPHCLSKLSLTPYASEAVLIAPRKANKRNQECSYVNYLNTPDTGQPMLLFEFLEWICLCVTIIVGELYSADEMETVAL